MAIDTLISPLLGHEIFQGLSLDQLTQIARRAERIVYRPGDTIASRDTDSAAAVLIVTGSAVRTSGPADFDFEKPILPGSLIGEMQMLIETEHSSTIIAQTQMRALRILRAEVHEQMLQDSTLADHFVKKISSRLSNLTDELRHVLQQSLAHTDGKSDHPAGNNTDTERQAIPA